jgi:hypothetical protein
VHFPRGRVLRRVYERSVSGLAWPWGAIVSVASFAIIGATFTLPAHPTWSERFTNGIASAALAVVLVFLIAMVWHLWSYRHSGRTAGNWIATGCLTGNAAGFYFRRKDESLPEPLHTFGILQCVIKTPDGVFVAFPDDQMYPFGSGHLTAIYEGGGPGTYEARWYSTTNKRRRYSEITRAKLALATPDGHEVLPS